MSEETMDNRQPLTPESFVNKNLATIKRVFPNLVHGENTLEGSDFLKPEATSSLIAQVEDQIWGIMGNDPVLKRLGREGYNVLPEEERLKILEDAVRLLDAAQEADEFLTQE